MEINLKVKGAYGRSDTDKGMTERAIWMSDLT